jgi:hypothetical protein
VKTASPGAAAAVEAAAVRAGAAHHAAAVAVGQQAARVPAVHDPAAAALAPVEAHVRVEGGPAPALAPVALDLAERDPAVWAVLGPEVRARAT